MFESQAWIWVGIALCVSQSAIFSGLNLAYFSISRLRLEAEAQHNSKARKILDIRRDSNYLLTTILWGNVAANTLLALLANSVMSGITAFLFSTILITFLGEICPQAFFSRKAMQVAAAFSPLLRFYQIVFLPLALPTARLLDSWLGKETVQLMREKTLRNIILRHVQSESAEIAQIEGLGALNFLDLDDLLASGEGQAVNPNSVFALPEQDGKLRLPDYKIDRQDPFLRQVHESGNKWIILTGPDNHPELIMDADEFLRDQMFSDQPVPIMKYCHQPIVVTDAATPLGVVISQIKYQHKATESEPMKRDVALLWNDAHQRVITGSDILDNLLQGLHQPEPTPE